jgi:NADP-dependent 3-hydroxy acid dehydrogenase YdfG
MKSVTATRRHFAGKVALITGAGSGIGRSLALRIALAGGIVYAIDCEERSLQTLVSDRKGTERPRPVMLDVTDARKYQSVVTEIEKEEGKIDYLFNNAGVTMLAEAHKLDISHWRWLLDINVMGVIHGIHFVYPKMVHQGFGHIVNTASVAGSTGYATAAAYAMSKASIIELSRSLRAEARYYGVRVSVVCPGYVRSNIFSQERVVGADLDAVLQDLPVAMMNADKAAQAILVGVTRKRETIIFPSSARVLWLLSQWTPSLLAPIQERLIRPFRGIDK